MLLEKKTYFEQLKTKLSSVFTHINSSKKNSPLLTVILISVNYILEAKLAPKTYRDNNFLIISHAIIIPYTTKK